LKGGENNMGLIDIGYCMVGGICFSYRRWTHTFNSCHCLHCDCCSYVGFRCV